MAGPSQKFGPVSLGIFSVVMLNVWGYAAGTLGVGLYGGGVPVFIYGSLAVGAATTAWALFLAEGASAYPSKSGLIYLATKLSGPKYGNIAGFFTGGFHTISALFTPSALVLVSVQLMASVGVAVNPSWAPQKWQIFLMYQGFNLLAMLTVVYLSKIMNWLSNIGGAVLFLALFITIGLLTGLSNHDNPNEFVWRDIMNGTGWSTAMCILIGITGPAYAYGPSHWLLNMANDVENPRRSIPIALGIQQVGNIIGLVSFYIAAGYSVTDWSGIMETAYPAPVGEVFQQAIHSTGGTIALLLVLTVVGVTGNISYVTASLRMVHGYAETGALPYQQWLTKWDKRGETPISIIYIAATVTVIMGCINLASESGFNIILGSCYITNQLGYLPALVGYIVTGGRYMNAGTQRWLRLPRWLTMFLAIFSWGFQLFLIVLYSLPTTFPITPENMNWACLFGIAGIIFLSVTWRARRRAFIGFPEDQIDGNSVVELSSSITIGHTKFDSV